MKEKKNQEHRQSQKIQEQPKKKKTKKEIINQTVISSAKQKNNKKKNTIYEQEDLSQIKVSKVIKSIKTNRKEQQQIDLKSYIKIQEKELKQLYSNQNYANCLKLCDIILDKDIKKKQIPNEKLFIFCAICYQNLKQFDSASKILKIGLQQYPDNEEILALKGKVEIYLQNFQEAKKIFSTLWKQNKNDIYKYYQIKCEIELKNYNWSLRQSQKLIDRNLKYFFQGSLQKLTCFIQLEQYMEAEQLSQTLFRKNPQSIHLMILKGLLYERQKNFQNSQICYYKALIRTKNSKLKLSCILMIVQQIINSNDYYRMIQFFDDYNSSQFFDKEVFRNTLFLYYNRFAKAIKELLKNNTQIAAQQLQDLFMKLNQVDNFLENRILSFLGYTNLKIRDFEKAIQYYTYKQNKEGLDNQELYNLKMSQVLFNFNIQQFDKVRINLDGLKDVLPCRIDVVIYKEVLKLIESSEIIFEYIDYKNYQTKNSTQQFQQLETMINCSIDTFLQFNEQDSNNSRILFILSLLNLIKANYNKSLEFLNQLIDKQDEFEWKAYFWRGINFVQQQDYLQGNRSFQYAQQIYCDEDLNDIINLIKFQAFSNLKSGEYERAKILIENYLQQHQNNFFFIELLGDIELLQNNLSKALKTYSGITQNSQNKERIYFKIFLISIYQNDLLSALKIIKILKEEFQRINYQIDYCFIKSLYLCQQKKYEKAIKKLKKVQNIKLSEDQKSIFQYHHYFNYIGVYYWFIKDFKMSLKYFEQTSQILENMKQTIIQCQKNDEQITLIEEEMIENLEIQLEQIQFNKALCFLATGELNKFKEFFETFDNEQLKSVLKSLFSSKKEYQNTDLNDKEIELTLFQEKQNLSDNFDFFQIKMDGKNIKPKLQFHWPEPEFKLENMSFNLILIQEFKFENFMFEPIFPWIKTNNNKRILVSKNKKEIVQKQKFKSVDQLQSYLQQNQIILQKQFIEEFKEFFKQFKIKQYLWEQDVRKMT